MCKFRLFVAAAMRRRDASIHTSRERIAPLAGVLPAYDRLLRHVRCASDLLARRTSGRSDAPDVDRALVALALHHADWLAPVEAWRPTAASSWRQLSSLAQHLLARFVMPGFWVSAWLDGEPGQRTPQQAWYKAVGRGESLRRIGLPLRITRALAHRFTQAPHHLSVIAALRWAQTRALGGSDALASALSATRLGHELLHEDFWETVVDFLARHPELDLMHVGPIVDFLHHQRLQPIEGITPDGQLGLLPPPQAELTLKGRTPASLLRLVDAWHGQLRATGPLVTWAPQPLRPLRHVETIARYDDDDRRRGEVRIWTLTELCSSAELELEGRMMRHCVSTYVAACRRGRSSIWSLQLETRSGRQRRLTLELEPQARRIVQLRRRFNCRPQPDERAIVAMWADRERLRLDELPRVGV